MKLQKNVNAVQPTDKMAITPKGLKLMLAGVIVMVSGYVLMCGGSSDDPNVFSYDIFDFRRTVVAPLVIIAGIVVEIVAIMGLFRGGCSRKAVTSEKTVESEKSVGAGKAANVGKSAKTVSGGGTVKAAKNV